MKHKNSVGWFRRSSPTILICISAIGVVGTAILAAKAAPKAKRLLEEAEKEKGETLTKTEIVKVAAPAYIPAAASGVLTIACMFSANVLSMKSQASIMSAYALLDRSYRRYQGKIKELFGEEAYEQVMNEILAEEADPNNVIYAESMFSIKSLDFGVEGEVQRRFYDCVTGKAFNSTIEKVLQAEYHLNRNFTGGGPATLNTLYRFLGLEPLEDGDDRDWYYILEDEMYWIDFNHWVTTLDDGFEYCMIDYTPPLLDQS